MSNQNSSTLYSGVTSNLIKRVYEHKTKKDINSFTSRYNVNKLVYFEVYEEIEEAIKREKQIKGGSRIKKLELIKSKNMNFKDLYEDIC